MQKLMSLKYVPSSVFVLIVERKVQISIYISSRYQFTTEEISSVLTMGQVFLLITIRFSSYFRTEEFSYILLSVSQQYIKGVTFTTEEFSSV